MTRIYTPGAIHVVPLNDLVEHVDDQECLCQPKLHTEYENYTVVGYIWVHNSWDGRELWEKQEEES